MNDSDTNHTVLLLGATGRTGGRALQQMLDRGVAVRAIVRSAERLPAGAMDHPGLTVLEAELSSLSQDELIEQVRGCDAVVSCLGHNITAQGMYGRPRDLVEGAIRRMHDAIVALKPSMPVKVVLMSSVSVNRPNHADTRRGVAERGVLAVIRALVPPAEDNQRAADFLCREVGPAHQFVEWVVVRPDTLLEGDVCEYVMHEGLVGSLAKPDHTQMANVAHFMCDLVTEPDVWDAWQGRMPVLVDAV